MWQKHLPHQLRLNPSANTSDLLGLFTSSRLIIAARFLTHKCAAVAISSCHFRCITFFLSEMLLFSKCNGILIWVITLKSTNTTSVCVQESTSNNSAAAQLVREPSPAATWVIAMQWVQNVLIQERGWSGAKTVLSNCGLAKCLRFNHCKKKN